MKLIHDATDSAVLVSRGDSGMGVCPRYRSAALLRSGWQRHLVLLRQKAEERVGRAKAAPTSRFADGFGSALAHAGVAPVRPAPGRAGKAEIAAVQTLPTPRPPCQPYEPMNLFHFTIPDISQIKDLRARDSPKVKTIHIHSSGDQSEPGGGRVSLPQTAHPPRLSAASGEGCRRALRYVIGGLKGAISDPTRHDIPRQRLASTACGPA
jgi:hypothetical protein